jgi:hypothetical protein
MFADSQAAAGARMIAPLPSVRRALAIVSFRTVS